MGVIHGGWNKATPFPFIQGTDCCGRIVTNLIAYADAGIEELHIKTLSYIKLFRHHLRDSLQIICIHQCTEPAVVQQYSHAVHERPCGGAGRSHLFFICAGYTGPHCITQRISAFTTGMQ